MRGVLWVGGFVAVGLVVFVVLPSFALQNSGSATLVQVNSTTVLGTATLSPTRRGQATTITVQVQHLVPNSAYALSVHAGSCFGTLLTALNPAVTDMNGTGSSNTTLDAPIESSWFIVLHSGHSTRNAVLACGQVVLNTVVIQPTSTPVIIPTMPEQFPNTGGGPPQP
ncbi:MAG TPA: hypothetical protein VH590_13270 [Ktedonobacterales bacterium]